MIYRDPPTLEEACSGRYAFGPVHEDTPAGTKMNHYWEEYASPLGITLTADLRRGEFYDVGGYRVLPSRGLALVKRTGRLHE